MAGNISQFYLEGHDNLSRVFENIEKSVVKLQGSMASFEKANVGVGEALKKNGQHLENVDKSMSNLGGTLTVSMLKTHLLLKAFDSLDRVFYGLVTTFKRGLEVNIDTEKTKYGIAATLATVYEFRDAISGIKLEGVEKFNASMKVSDDIMRRLTISAITTAASVKDVREAFSAAISFGANLGMTPQQVERMSTMIANASKVFGLQQGQAAQELRTILTGKIDKTSTIGTSLGLGAGGPLSKEFQDALSKGGEELSKFMDKTLSEYKRAAETMSQQLAGIFDSASEVFDLFAKDASEPMAKELTRIKAEIIDKLFVIDAENGIYNWTEQFKPLMAMLQVLGKDIGAFLVDTLKSAVQSATDFGKAMEDNPSIFNGLIESAKTFLSGIVTAFGAAFNIINAVFDVIASLGDGLESLFGSSEDVSEAIDGVGKSADKSKEKVEDLGKDGKKSLRGLSLVVETLTAGILGINIALNYIKDVFGSFTFNIKFGFLNLIDVIGRSLVTLIVTPIAVMSDVIKEVGLLLEKMGIGFGRTMAEASNKLGNEIVNKFFSPFEKSRKELEEMSKQTPKVFAGTIDAINTFDKVMSGLNKNRIEEQKKQDEQNKKQKQSLVDLYTTEKKNIQDNIKAKEQNYKDSKKLNENEIKLWDMYNSYGLIQLETFFSRKNELQEKSYQEEVSYINQMIAYYGGLKSVADKSKSADAQKDSQEATAKLTEWTNKLKEVEGQRYFNQQKGWLEERKAMIERSQLMTDYIAQIEELKGNSAVAAQLKLNTEIAKLQEQYKADENMLALIEQLKTLKQVQLDFNNARKEYNNLINAQTTAEETQQIKLKQGKIGEIDYLTNIQRIRTENISKIKDQISSMEKLNLTNPEDINQLNQLKNKLLELEVAVDPVKQKFDELFITGFQENLLSVIEGTKSIGDAFKDLAKTIEREITRLVAQQLSQKLFANISSSFGGNSAGSLVSSLFGLFGYGGGRATGGTINAMSPVLVGESGSELFFPRTQGYIANAPKTQDYMRGNGQGNVYNINIPIQATDVQSFRNSEAQIAQTIQRAILMGNKNN